LNHFNDCLIVIQWKLGYGDHSLFIF
jgi:hypothetical protein